MVISVEAKIPEALLELIDDPAITDICLAEGSTQVDSGSGLRTEAKLALTEKELSILAKDLIELGGRRLDQANPFADVSLPGGLRVHAVLKSACTESTLVSIRLHSTNPLDLDSLLSDSYATSAQSDLIQEIAGSGESFLISGSTGTGKTTLLRAMLSETTERVIAVEDVTELSGKNIITLQTKPKNIEGVGEISLDDLVRQALRMRPDRICIGEVRGQELVPMLQALNTGHRGATTLHSNSLEQVPERLLSIATQQGMNESTLSRLAASAFNWVISLDFSQGTRAVAGVGKFQIVDDKLVVISQLRSRKLQLA
jgi:pilus assembly protein CpaF